MKKFMRNISDTTANAVNSAVKQMDKSLTQEPVAPTPVADKQYLRLPIDSAKKLRWFDKADVAALTRQHVREKHMLLDTITALKKVMIRAGFTDASLDEEARQLVAAAEAVRVADTGVESVLLLAVQAEMEALAGQKQVLEEEVQQLRDRVQQHQQQQSQEQHQHPSTDHQQQQHSQQQDSQQQESQQLHMQPTNGEAGSPHTPCLAAPAGSSIASNSMLEDLQDSSEGTPAAGQVDNNTKVASGEGQHSVEQLQPEQQQEQQQEHSLQELVQQQDQDAPQQQQQQSTAEASIAREQQKEGADQQGFVWQQEHLFKPSPAASAASSTGQLNGQQAMPGDVATAHVVKRYKEFTLQLEERCRSAERQASLSTARVASLEESLAAAQQALAAAQQRGAQAAAAARKEIGLLEGRLRAAESSAATAAASAALKLGSAGGSVAAAAAAAAAASEQLPQLQQQLAASKAQVTGLERRLAHAEGREASLLSELRHAEAAAAERDAALTTAAATREQLKELGRERSQLEHYKQRVAGLESAKADLEQQLASLAGHVAQLEAKIRDLIAQNAAASAAAELAAATATQAQAAVAEQVAAHLAAAGGTRSLWPPAAQQEVEELEEQVHKVQAALSTAQADLQTRQHHLQQEQEQRAHLHKQLQTTEAKLIQVQQDAELRVADLQSNLGCCQQDADKLRNMLLQLEEQQQQWQQRQHSLNVGRTFSTSGQALISAGSGIVNSPTAGLANSSSNSNLWRLSNGDNGSLHRKWQEQNKVGGGSLYGVTDKTVEYAAVAPVGSTGQREMVSGVDLVYVKNVVLKFLEAVMAGKVGERDALLPAVAAVLQATPAEFAAMRKVLAATAPPTTQMMSVLGRLAQLAS